MFASIEAALDSIVQTDGAAFAGPEADSSFLFAFWLVLGTSLVAVAVISIIKFLPQTKAPQSQRVSRPPARPNPQCVQRLREIDQEPPRSQRTVRRVIRLHAVTPGQSEHEYNVGDQQGTRGSALVRVA